MHKSNQVERWHFCKYSVHVQVRIRNFFSQAEKFRSFGPVDLKIQRSKHPKIAKLSENTIFPMNWEGGTPGEK